MGSDSWPWLKCPALRQLVHSHEEARRIVEQRHAARTGMQPSGIPILAVDLSAEAVRLACRSGGRDELVQRLINLVKRYQAAGWEVVRISAAGTKLRPRGRCAFLLRHRAHDAGANASQCTAPYKGGRRQCSFRCFVQVLVADGPCRPASKLPRGHAAIIDRFFDEQQRQPAVVARGDSSVIEAATAADEVAAACDEEEDDNDVVDTDAVPPDVRAAQKQLRDTSWQHRMAQYAQVSKNTGAMVCTRPTSAVVYVIIRGIRSIAAHLHNLCHVVPSQSMRPSCCATTCMCAMQLIAGSGEADPNIWNVLQLAWKANRAAATATRDMDIGLAGFPILREIWWVAALVLKAQWQHAHHVAQWCHAQSAATRNLSAYGAPLAAQFLHFQSLPPTLCCVRVAGWSQAIVMWR